MTPHTWRRVTGVVVLGCALATSGACRSQLTNDTDRDRDGFADALEMRLATTFMPAIHQFTGAGGRDACLGPSPRPVIFRARPRVTENHRDAAFLAVTYVLLYERDCGGLGHEDDDEAFTTILARDSGPGSWRVVRAFAMAHAGTSAEVTSVGDGRAIWVSRDKHANYANMDACDSSDILPDECAPNGDAPASYAWLNAGEPRAPLSNDVGDVWQTTAPTKVPDALFRGRAIWDHVAFGGGGDIASQLVVDHAIMSRLSGMDWDDTGG